MTWLALANMLFDESQALSPTGAHLHLDTAAWLRTWTPHQNSAADIAARHFVQSRAWPAMAPEVACQLYFRCLFAIERCIECHAEGRRSAGLGGSEDQELEKLLVSSWHLEGLDWAERRYSRSSLAQNLTAVGRRRQFSVPHSTNPKRQRGSEKATPSR
jgi:hypothetical protein